MEKQRYEGSIKALGGQKIVIINDDSNEIKTVSFSSVVVHQSNHFLFGFVLKYIVFSAILFS